ncbi:MAG: exostosin family protein [Chthoniobacterales bacterium]|nr:exostosin family protein [Chthoniobacterales bacterium]
MAKVFLLSVASGEGDGDYNRGAYRGLMRSAQADAFRIHALIDDPAGADLILFAELHGAGPYFEKVRTHPLVRRYREKCFLFSSTPYVIPFLPGIYTSIERRWATNRTRAGSYLGVSENEFVVFSKPAADLPWLYGFLGSTATAEVRRRLRTLAHPRGFFQDTAVDQARVLRGELSSAEMRAYWRRYAESIRTSKFVLCPRGVSTSSVRLFDVMRMGRVPVILSDQWVAPSGPAWEEISIRIPENDLSRIILTLERREGEAVAMGRRARAVWDEWFAERACFHRVVEWCLEIKAGRRLSEKWAHLPPYLQYLRPFHFRHRLRTRYHALREKLAP